jgi:hypothetical protein
MCGLNTAPARPDGTDRLLVDRVSEELGDARLRFGIVLAALLYVATELPGIESGVLRLAATAAVLIVVAPTVLVSWRTGWGLAVLALWALLSVVNLLSPLRSMRSAIALSTCVLSIILVVSVVRLVGGDRFRHFLTALAASVLAAALVGRAAAAAASGTLSLSDLRVDTSAAGMWKGLVILSPCPVRALPARVAFLGFKVVLVFLMLTVDRPKIGVLLSVTLAATVGGVALLLHRASRTRNVIMMCFTLLPVAVLPAMVVGNLLVKQYVRRSDFSGRTVLWRAALEEFFESGSIVGVGFRNSLTSPEALAAMSERFGGDFGPELGGNAVHNVYLQLSVEFGLIGIALVIVVLVLTVLGLFRIRSITMQSCLAVDLLFAFGLCITEPILEPNTVIFTLLCLTIVRIRWHSSATVGSPLRGSEHRLGEDLHLLGAGGAR